MRKRDVRLRRLYSPLTKGQVFSALLFLKDSKPVTNTTAGLGGDPCTPGPILLQDHGNPVQYRNIWLLPRK